MQRFKVLVVSLFIVLCAPSSCTNENNTLEKESEISDLVKKSDLGEGHKSGSWLYKMGDTTQTVVWNSFESKEKPVKVNILSEWKTVPNSNYLFFAYLDHDNKQVDKNQFCVILNHSNEISLNEYLKTSYEIMKNDTVEMLLGNNVYQINFGRRDHAFYGEYVTKINGVKYKTYFYYVKKEGYLFDFSYKKAFDNIGYFEKLLFGDFVSSFRFRGNQIIDLKQEIIYTKPVIFKERES